MAVVLMSGIYEPVRTKILRCHPWQEIFFFSSRRRHTSCLSDWSSDVCSSDLVNRYRGGLPHSQRSKHMNVILITGGSRGIGAATAQLCARHGMGVILTYNSNRQAAESVVALINAEGGKAVALELDVGDVGSFGVFVEAVRRALQSTWQKATLKDRK